ncbi:MAG: hypothetical protein ACE14M_02580 [Terriglobales bacterium]
MGHHPPEVNAADILHQLRVTSTRVPAVIVQSAERNSEPFRALGASATIQNPDVDSIKQALQSSVCNSALPSELGRSA